MEYEEGHKDFKSGYFEDGLYRCAALVEPLTLSEPQFPYPEANKARKGRGEVGGEERIHSKALA